MEKYMFIIDISVSAYDARSWLEAIERNYGFGCLFGLNTFRKQPKHVILRLWNRLQATLILNYQIVAQF